MRGGTDPDILITDVWDIAYKMGDSNEPVSEARIADILIQGLPPSYDAILICLQADMNSNVQLGHIEHVARSMFISRNRTAQQQRGPTNTFRGSGMMAVAAKKEGDTGHHLSRIKCYTTAAN